MKIKKLDPEGGVRSWCPLLGPFFKLFSYSFGGNLAKNMLAPPPWGLASPRVGSLASATESTITNIKSQTYCRYKRLPMQDKLVDVLRNWSSVDVMLHKVFNETLWKNIAKYGEGFWNELNFYQTHLQRIVDFCSNISNTKRIIVPESPWGNEFIVDYMWC